MTKLLVVLIADYEAKQFPIERASGVDVPRELMDANGLLQKDLADDLSSERIVSLILKEKRQGFSVGCLTSIASASLAQVPSNSAESRTQ